MTNGDWSSAFVQTKLFQVQKKAVKNVLESNVVSVIQCYLKVN